VRRDVVLRFVAAATSPSDLIGFRRTVGGGGQTSGRRRGRDGTAAAALGPRPTVLRPTPNTLSVQRNLYVCWCNLHNGSIFTVRRSYASAVLAVILLSVTRVLCN